MMQVKRRKGLRMRYDVGEAMESLENEQSSQSQSQQSSFSNLSVTSSTSQLILQPFSRFTYVTAHSPTLPLLQSTSQFILQPFFRFSYVRSSSLNSPGQPPMKYISLYFKKKERPIFRLFHHFNIHQYRLRTSVTSTNHSNDSLKFLSLFLIQLVWPVC